MDLGSRRGIGNSNFKLKVRLNDMTNVVVVVEDGRITEVLCRNKNISVEILDMDTQDIDDLEQRQWRLGEIHKSKSYKDII